MPKLWVRLNASRGAPLEPVEAMTVVIQALEPLTKLPEGETEIQDLYRDLLHKRRCLIVFDDAKDANQLRPLLPTAPSAALITSRQTIALGGTTIKLPFLSEAEAVAVLHQILTKHGRTTISGEELAQLAEGCRYLPLALQAAGAFLGKRESWTISQYLAALPDQRRRMTQLFKHADDETLDVYAVLSLSVERLRENTPEAARLWLQLAVFPAAFDAMAADAVWACPENGAGEMLDDLVRNALVEVASRSEAGARFRLHDFLRDVAEAELRKTEGEAGASRQAAEARFAGHYKELLDKTNRLYAEGGDQLSAGLALYDLEAINIAHGHALALRRMEEADSGSARLIADYAGAGSMILDLRLIPRTRLSWLQAQHDASVQFGDRRGECYALGNMGAVWVALSEPRKGIDHYQQSLAIARELGDRGEEGNSLCGIGIACGILGEEREAIAYYRRALAIHTEVGSKHGEGNILANMGLAYAALGETRKAIKLYEQAFTIFDQIGPRRYEANTLANMGLAYADLGERHIAIQYLKQASVIFSEIGDYSGEANLLLSWGLIVHDARQAIALYERALSAFCEIGNRRGEGDALNNLGSAYAALGEPHKAIRHQERALALFREIGDQRGIGNALFNLAIKLKKMGQTAVAHARMEEAYNVYSSIDAEIVAQDARRLLEEWSC